MIFLGTSFCSDKYSLHHPASRVAVMTTLQIFDGTYNHLYLSKDPDKTVNNITDPWDYDTVINAPFIKGFDGGNSGFSLNNTDHVVIRRRECGTLKWTTIYVKEIHTVKDFDIHIVDKYARSGVVYEYAVSSFVNGVENSYLIKNVFSEFEGYYITDKDCLYGTIYDVDG